MVYFVNIVPPVRLAQQKSGTACSFQTDVLLLGQSLRRQRDDWSVYMLESENLVGFIKQQDSVLDTHHSSQTVILNIFTNCVRLRRYDEARRGLARVWITSFRQIWRRQRKGLRSDELLFPSLSSQPLNMISHQSTGRVIKRSMILS